MILSIQNVSRLAWLFQVGMFLVMLLVTFLIVGAVFVALAPHSDQPSENVIFYLLIGPFFVSSFGSFYLSNFVFRCPRCHRSSSTKYGRFKGGAYWWFSLPFWAPRLCSRCGLDFTVRTFWQPDNHALRAAWVAQGSQ